MGGDTEIVTPAPPTMHVEIVDTLLHMITP